MIQNVVTFFKSPLDVRGDPGTPLTSKGDLENNSFFLVKKDFPLDVRGGPGIPPRCPSGKFGKTVFTLTGTLQKITHGASFSEY